MRTASPASPNRVDELLADHPVHRGDLVGGRRQPGADGPDRLVGDDEVAAGGLVGDRSRELAGDHRLDLPAFALGPGFADADDRREPGARAPPGPWRAPDASVSPCPARRSEWPTITNWAPASASMRRADVAGIGAAGRRMAVLAAGERSPAGATRRSAATSSVAGGQIATSRAGGCAGQQAAELLDLGKRGRERHSSSSCRRSAGECRRPSKLLASCADGGLP